MDFRLEEKSRKIGVHIPAILMPDAGIDLSKWSVVACDQYTSQPEYWTQVNEIVKDNPSTLDLILPEIYLEDCNIEEKIKSINKNMELYLKENVLLPQNPGFIYVTRKTSDKDSRKGLVLSVDLEKYDYNKGSQTLIRSTEGTVVERIPPRIKIRESAPIELPHIILLIDDTGNSVIEPLSDRTKYFKKLYDFDLMMDGGHITGYKIEDEKTLSDILSALEKLVDPFAFTSKYGEDAGKGVLLFAVGDGNHSLASAKANWENVKRSLDKKEIHDHPSRFALVEVINVYDESLKFEPIHRVVFNTDVPGFLDDITSCFNKYSPVTHKVFETYTEMENNLIKPSHLRDRHMIPYVAKHGYGLLYVENPCYNLEVATLQAFIDEWLKKNPKTRVDYIHGKDVVTSLGSVDGNIGFYLPPMDKHALFKTIISEGCLPRKTFSIGEPNEKRYYLECRKIKKL